MSRRIAIVGAGHAAGQLIATLKQKKFSGDIVLLGEEPYLPYQRPPLSKKFLAGEIPAERLHFKPASFYADANIEIRLDTRVTQIDRGDKALLTAAGERIRYDTLVLATGSRVREIEVPGHSLAGVHYLRNIADVDRIRSELGPGRKACIVGAGYIGLEVAAVLRQCGLDVTVLEMADRVMSRVVSRQVSAFFQQEHRSQGVRLELSTGLQAFVGEERVTAVELTNGKGVAADFVVVGIGIVPNTELAEAAGLDVDDGIVVDEHCATRDDDIYAVGDCTTHPNAIYDRPIRLESVHNALEQAKTAATNICGESLAYRQVPWFWSDQYDLKLQIAGLSEGYDEVVMRGEPKERAFSCVYLRAGRMIAVDAINAPRDFMQAKTLIADGAMPDRAKLADASVMLKDLAENPAA